MTTRFDRPDSRLRAPRPMRLEILEDRCVPATFEVVGTTLLVNGTQFADKITFTAQNAFHNIRVETPSTGANQIRVFSPAQISAVIIDGKGDFDTLELNGNAGKDTAILSPKSGTFQGNSYFVAWNRAEGVKVNSGDPLNSAVDDTAIFKDSDNAALIDTFIGSPTNSGPNSSQMYRDDPGNNYRNTANGFRTVQAFSHGGPDVAVLNDSFQNDTFTSVGDGKYAEIHDTSNSYSISTSGFNTVIANASAGVGQDNQAFLVDSSRNDRFTATENNATMQAGGMLASVNNFNAVTGLFVNGGFDSAFFSGTTADENFSGDPGQVSLSRNGVIKSAVGAEEVFVDMTQGGTDTAYLYDSPGIDAFIGNQQSGVLIGAGYTIATRGFDVIRLYGLYGDSNLLLLSNLSYLFYNEGFTP